MTNILNVTKTYNDNFKHDGYFIVTNNYRLKWCSAWQWSYVIKRPAYDRFVDSWIQNLKDA